MKFIRDWFHNKEIEGLKVHLAHAQDHAREESRRAHQLSEALKKAISDKVDADQYSANTVKNLLGKIQLLDEQIASDASDSEELIAECKNTSEEAAKYKADNVSLIARLIQTQEKLDQITSSYADMQVARLEENVSRQQVEEQLSKVQARYKKLGIQFRALKKGKAKKVSRKK